MISCEIFRRHLDAVVDGEVDTDTQIEFDQHLASCGPCRVHLGFATSFKRQVKEACSAAALPLELAPPVDLASRIQRALDAEDARRAALDPTAPVGTTRAGAPPLGLAGVKLLPVKARYAVPAAAAAVALAVFASHEGGNPASGDDIVDARSASAGGSIFEDVVRRHSSEHPVEVSGPPMQVASWFRGKLEFPVRPPELRSPGAQLVGARISNIRDREAAAFFYLVQGRRVTVMVFEPPGPNGGLAQRANVRRADVQGRGVYFGLAHGHTVPLVEYEGLTYAFAGDLDSRSLLQLAASARIGGR